MDPGHPTIPYNGPYNPDYRPTRPSVEDVFHLPPLTEKPPPLVKEKTKSKSELAKKPVEPLSKPHKDDYFPGPLAPDKFPDKHISISVHSNENQHLPGPLNPNKLPSPQKPGPPIDQPQFIPLNPHRDLGPGFAFAPTNVPQGGLDPQLDNSAVGPAYHGPLLGQDSVDPNVIVPVSPKKKAPPSDVFDAERGKPAMGLPGRPKQGQRNPEQEILPEELYHLINLQHPGLVHLDHGPPEGHPGIFDIHQQISGQKHSPTNQIQPGYFGAGPKKPSKPHVYAQKNENGQTTYHVHTQDIPSTPQQIEELLAHINQHDPNPGPFQHYPGQPAISHNVAGGPTATMPLHIDAHLPHSGLTHMNHPFAAQTPNQSGSSLISNTHLL